MNEDDLDDLRVRTPFWLSTEDLPLYSVRYAGRQGVDQVGTYVFDVTPQGEPKNSDPKKVKKLFQRRIWVDDHDFVVVKTCGRPRPQTFNKQGQPNLVAQFATYREPVDAGNWFPTYARADEYLRFSTGLVRLRELVRYSDYKLPPE